LCHEYTHYHPPDIPIHEPVPEELKENMNHIRRVNPEYQYRFYSNDDCDDYISTYFSKEILSAYRSINSSYGAARADLFRYLVIYQEGGVYLDLKSSTTLPLSTVLLDDDKYILSNWDNSPSGISLAGSYIEV
jgi:mannosyltransferase OCH1-like enzyme